MTRSCRFSSKTFLELLSITLLLNATTLYGSPWDPDAPTIPPNRSQLSAKIVFVDFPGDTATGEPAIPFDSLPLIDPPEGEEGFCDQFERYFFEQSHEQVTLDVEVIKKGTSTVWTMPEPYSYYRDYDRNDDAYAFWDDYVSGTTGSAVVNAQVLLDSDNWLEMLLWSSCRSHSASSCGIGVFSNNDTLRDLENSVEAVRQARLLFQNSHQHVGRDSDPDLGLHRVLGRAVESLDTQVLLDPFEEELDLPARPV